MITIDSSRELLTGAPCSEMLSTRRGASPRQRTHQGSSVPSGRFGVLARGPVFYRDGVVTPITPATPSGVSAPSNKAPLSGVPAWSPPVT